jgi:hypothetical protein
MPAGSAGWHKAALEGAGHCGPAARHFFVLRLLVNGAGADGIRSLIRAGRFSPLSSEIECQKRQLIGGQA